MELTNDTFLDAFADAIARRLETMQGQRQRLRDIKGAAEYLDMTEEAVYHLVSRKKLRPVRFDSRNRFDVRDLDKLIESGKKDGNS